MQIKSELLDLLIGYGMTADEIAELANRLALNAEDYDKAALAAEAELVHNQAVRIGLEQTLADARMKSARATSLLSKISDPDPEPEPPVEEPPVEEPPAEEPPAEEPPAEEPTPEPEPDPELPAEEPAP